MIALSIKATALDQMCIEWRTNMTAVLTLRQSCNLNLGVPNESIYDMCTTYIQVVAVYSRLQPFISSSTFWLEQLNHKLLIF